MIRTPTPRLKAPVHWKMLDPLGANALLAKAIPRKPINAQKKLLWRQPSDSKG
jgi:hypothetical protein